MAVVQKKRKVVRDGLKVDEQYDFWSCDRDGRRAVGQLKDKTTGLILDVCEGCKAHLMTLTGFVEYGGGRTWE